MCSAKRSANWSTMIDSHKDRISDLRSATIMDELHETASQTEMTRVADIELLDRFGDQLERLENQLLGLQRLDPHAQMDSIDLGAVVSTDHRNFIIGPSIEEFQVDGRTFQAYSRGTLVRGLARQAERGSRALRRHHVQRARRALKPTYYVRGMELYDISIGARVKHPTLGVGVVYEMDERTVHIFFREHGEQPISRSFEGLVTIAPGVEIGGAELDMDSVKDALREVLEEFNVPQRPVELARRYHGACWR